MTQFKIDPKPYRRGAAFLTLLEKEVLRFKKIAIQTIFAPILMAALYLVVFGQVLGGRMPTFEGVSYIHFLVPGLVMMSLLQNAFGNSSSSMLSAKIMGSLIFIQLPPFAGWELGLAMIGASVARGLIVGAGVLLVSVFWSAPPIDHILWVVVFGFMGAVLMGSLGLIAGLWAEKFDQIGAFQSFVILPLTFLSGVFYSIQQLPGTLRTLSQFNPFFYIVDGFRYGFFSQSDFNPWISLSVVSVCAVGSAAFAVMLMQRGYKIQK